jgi:hypothetical protein
MKKDKKNKELPLTPNLVLPSKSAAYMVFPTGRCSVVSRNPLTTTLSYPIIG